MGGEALERFYGKELNVLIPYQAFLVTAYFTIFILKT
jgi:hypothetical protein